MAEFVCKVGDISGRVFDQVETAQSEAEARQKLADRGFYVYGIRSHLDVISQLTRPKTDRSIRTQDFLIFNQQFNTLLKAGLPILKALDLLGERAAAERLRPIISDVRQRVRDGALLSDALAAQGSFPPVYVTAISAGERSGNLSGVLDQYISYLRVSTGFKRQLITALIYPSILVGSSCAGDVVHGDVRDAQSSPASTRTSTFRCHESPKLFSAWRRRCGIISSFSRWSPRSPS